MKVSDFQNEWTGKYHYSYCRHCTWQTSSKHLDAIDKEEAYHLAHCKPAHPYPVEVVTAVADELKALTASRIEAGNLAHKVLQAAWQASEVKNQAELQKLPSDALLETKLGHIEDVSTMVFREMPHDYPAHVIHWGDQE